MIAVARRNQHSQQIAVFNRQIKLIQEKRLDCIATKILELETQRQQCEKVLHQLMSKMYEHFRDPSLGDLRMTRELMELVHARTKIIADQWRERYSFRFRYHLICPFGDWEALEDNMDNTNTTHPQDTLWLANLGYQPQVCLGVLKHSLNQQELRLLNRGPTYVPPYRLHVSSNSLESTEVILRKQYAPLKHQFAGLFYKYDIVVGSQLTIQNSIYEHFKLLYSVSLPPHFYERGMYEKNMVQRIRQTITKNELVLRRTADNMNTFYLGSRSDFEQRAEQYLASTDNYEVFYISSKEDYRSDMLHRTRRMTEQNNNSLRVPRRRNDISGEMWDQLRAHSDLTQLSYLYFLPDLSKNNDLTLVPTITSSSHHMVYRLSQFLDQLLRPFAQKHMKSEVFQDETDFIYQLNKYAAAAQCPLTPTTLLCTIKVLNYSALDTHVNMIDTICKFIHENVAANKLGKLRIDTIKNLLQLCLCHTIFCHQNKLYKFIRGGPTTLPLMDTLANICLFVWQRNVFRGIEAQKEFSGRYKDHLFLTWHNLKDELDRFLQRIAEAHPHVKLETSIGLQVNYLHASISNENGQLVSRMYQNPTMSAYTLPYVLGHARVRYSNWLRTALIRAVCTCSSIEDFNRERVRIELTYLASGYSYDFLESHLAHLYTHFRVDTLRYDYNPTVYAQWRQKCFNFVSAQRSNLYQLRNRQETNRLFRFHYLHDYGKRLLFYEKFYDLWLTHFYQHPILGKEPMLILIFTKHPHSMNALLTQ